jgi:hypothetical protein
LRLVRAPVEVRPGDRLAQLARYIARTRVRHESMTSQLTTTLAYLSSLHGRSWEVLLELHAERRSPACTHACEVARLGLAEARSVLETHRDAPSVGLLRELRGKIYVSLMTVRYTLVGEQVERAPFWRTLMPTLSARVALADMRDSIRNLLPLQSGDLTWSSFVARSELRLLLTQPALSALAPSSRDFLSGALAGLKEVRDDDIRFERALELAMRGLGLALAELNAHEELRRNDEQALRQLLSFVLGDRNRRELGDSVRGLLLALRGLDSELDAVSAPGDAALVLPWSHVHARASELLSTQFGVPLNSGPPPRR